ncbi:hypothetical protein [Tenacibaculum haliotis]|uniref:hypothetical protein n=1 Tax=Tenacibaculum haliotis TaxID=1888914 RepID=UPI0021AF93BC|nr:hypothetical protein [Tenacibaculum haliotis]MCT4700048.1 hypothetical protein [Tenacibaculum haliotis]
MKKVILVVAMVFATSSLVNANDSSLTVNDDCMHAACGFGTRLGGGDEYNEWYWTNAYFDSFCNEDGSYKKRFN